MDYINDNLIDILKQEIDCYREKYTISQQEIKDLEMEIKRLNELNPHEVPKEFHTERYEKLQAENKRLNDKDGLYDEVKELQAEVERYKFHAETRANELVKRGAKLKELKDELQAVNDDYNNDHKVHNDYADGLLAEIKELKADNKLLQAQLNNYII